MGTGKIITEPLASVNTPEKRLSARLSPMMERLCQGTGSLISLNAAKIIDRENAYEDQKGLRVYWFLLVYLVKGV